MLSEESKENGYRTYHFNNIGSTVALTDSQGDIIYQYQYGSYGELLGVYGKSGGALISKETGKNVTPIEMGVRFLYNGQYGVVADQNGLYYMRARYYNTDCKRFMNRDVVIWTIGNSQSLNQYSYVQGNPISLTDPFGLCPIGNGSMGSLLSFLGHTILSVIGCTEPFGIVADLVNAAWYFAEGDTFMGTTSLISSLPGIGSAIGNGMKAGKFAKTGAMIAKGTRLLGHGTEAVMGGIDTGYAIKDAMSELSSSGKISFETGIGLAGGVLTTVLGGSAMRTKTPRGVTNPDDIGDLKKCIDKCVGTKKGGTIGMCFTAETLVKVENGHKAISEIRVGDYVYSENVTTGEKGYKKVKQVFVSEVTTLYHIRVKDQEIKTTAPHPFYVIGKGWVEAEDLVVGDQLKMANGETIKVEAITIETLKEPIKVYNFEVEDWHVYYVSDMEILVHNTGVKPCSAGNAVEGGVNLIPNKGFKTFNDLKAYLGNPGQGNQWHHFVEQSQIGKRANFNSEQVNNINNVIAISSGSGSIHSKISAHYSSKFDFTNGQTVRDWLSTKSFEEQFEYGKQLLEEFGDVKATEKGWVFKP